MLAEEDDVKLYRHWRTIVEEYTERHLTFGRNRLSALSGLASCRSRPTSRQHLAGCWESFLLKDLAWRCERPRPSTYLLPPSGHGFK